MPYYSPIALNIFQLLIKKTKVELGAFFNNAFINVLSTPYQCFIKASSTPQARKNRLEANVYKKGNLVSQVK